MSCHAMLDYTRLQHVDLVHHQYKVPDRITLITAHACAQAMPMRLCHHVARRVIYQTPPFDSGELGAGARVPRG